MREITEKSKWEKTTNIEISLKEMQALYDILDCTALGELYSQISKKYYFNNGTNSTPYNEDFLYSLYESVRIIIFNMKGEV